MLIWYKDALLLAAVVFVESLLH
jgi:hypothetical protein